MSAPIENPEVAAVFEALARVAVGRSSLA